MGHVFLLIYLIFFRLSTLYKQLFIERGSKGNGVSDSMQGREPGQPFVVQASTHMVHDTFFQPPCGSKRLGISTVTSRPASWKSQGTSLLFAFSLTWHHRQLPAESGPDDGANVHKWRFVKLQNECLRIA